AEVLGEPIEQPRHDQAVLLDGQALRAVDETLGAVAQLQMDVGAGVGRTAQFRAAKRGPGQTVVSQRFVPYGLQYAALNVVQCQSDAVDGDHRHFPGAGRDAADVGHRIHRVVVEHQADQGCV